MNFEFLTPTRIIFGPGVIARAGPLAAEFGQTALVVTGGGHERPVSLLAGLQAQGLATALFRVPSEPDVALLGEALRAARDLRCDLVIGFGGGSALDTAKATAILLGNEGEALDYLEVIGRGRPLARPGLPCIAIPTTAGTGTEVTRNAVLASPEHRVKVSLRSPMMAPRLALLDPELTHTLSPAITASTGLDALTQVLEPYVSHRANPITDAFCKEGLARAARSLRCAYNDSSDRAAREDMMVASLLGGLALSNAGLGAVHGFAGVLGGMYPAPHGAICARLLPFTAEFNVAALRARSPANPALARYEEVARILTGRQDARIEDGLAWLAELCTALDVPPLAAHGVVEADFAAIVPKVAAASSTKANPIPLTEDEMRTILERAL